MPLKLSEKLMPLILMGTWLSLVILKLLTESAVLPGLLWCAAGCLLLCLTAKFRIKLSAFQITWYLFVLLNMASCVAGPLLYREHAGGIRKYDIIFTFFVPTAVAFMLTTRKAAKLFFTYFRNIMLCFSLLGLFEFLTKNQFYSFLIRTESALYNFAFYSNPAAEGYRLTLLFYHPIYYAVLLSFALVCILYLPFRNKLLHMGAIFLIIFNILLTQSRTGWLLIALVFGLYQLKNNPKKFLSAFVLKPKRMISVLLVITVIAGAVFWFMTSDLTEHVRMILYQRFISAFVDQNYGARVNNLFLIGKIVREKGSHFLLFGGGFKYALTYLQMHPTTSGWTRAIDNQYASTLIDTGIIGLVTYLALILLCVNGFIRNKEKTDDIPYLIGILFFVSSFFYDPVNANIVYYFVVMCFGLLPRVTKQNSTVYEFRRTLSELTSPVCKKS